MEDEAERLRKRRAAIEKEGGKGTTGSGADDEGGDTEVEAEVGAIGESGELVGNRSSGSAGSVGYEPEGRDAEVRGEVLHALKASGRATGGEGARRREAGGNGDQSGDLSTDSEWEKVGDVR